MGVSRPTTNSPFRYSRNSNTMSDRYQSVHPHKGQTCSFSANPGDDLGLPSFPLGFWREAMRSAAEDLGAEMTEHIQFVIDSIRGIAAELDLEGTDR